MGKRKTGNNEGPDWFKELLTTCKDTRGSLLKLQREVLALPTITLAQWQDLSKDLRRIYNNLVHGINSSYYIKQLPYVPNAIKGRPFNLNPVTGSKTEETSTTSPQPDLQREGWNAHVQYLEYHKLLEDLDEHRPTTPRERVAYGRQVTELVRQLESIEEKYPFMDEKLSQDWRNSSMADYFITRRKKG